MHLACCHQKAEVLDLQQLQQRQLARQACMHLPPCQLLPAVTGIELVAGMFLRCRELAQMSISAGLISQPAGEYIKDMLRKGPVTVALNWTDLMPKANKVCVQTSTVCSDSQLAASRSREYLPAACCAGWACLQARCTCKATMLNTMANRHKSSKFSVYQQQICQIAQQSLKWQPCKGLPADSVVCPLHVVVLLTGVLGVLDQQQ